MSQEVLALAECLHHSLSDTSEAEMAAMDEAFTAMLRTRQVEFKLTDSNHLDYIAGLVREHGLPAYEAPLPELMAWLVRQCTGFMLDVGANSGLFSLLAAAANPQIKVCAFEPVQSAYVLLEANIALNPNLANRISVYKLGLSNAAGSFDFYETINDVGLVPTSSSLELSHAQLIGNYNKITIETDTTDNWTKRFFLGHVGLMKIDVEGHEYAVIQGARETILRNRPFVTIEVLSEAGTNRINQMLFELDYCDFVIAPEALRSCASVRPHSDGWNHLLCPTECVSQVLHACRELGLKLEIA